MLIFSILAVAVGLGLATIALGRQLAAGTTSQQILSMVTEDAPDSVRADLDRPLVVRFLGPAWVWFERAARTVTPSWWADRLRRNILRAGMTRWGLSGILSMKTSAALAGGLLGLAFGSVRWASLLLLFGFVVPDLWISRKAHYRQDEIRKSLPEALDLMAIAVQAGLGLEGAMALVAERLHGSLGNELDRVLREVQLGASRRDALHALRDRTDVPELSAFVLAIVQADTLGTPLGEVLRVQAAQMRMLRRQRARERAAKTPVKLLVPLLIGIFPALFVVIIGPGIIAIMRAFGG